MGDLRRRRIELSNRISEGPVYARTRDAPPSLRYFQWVTKVLVTLRDIKEKEEIRGDRTGSLPSVGAATMSPCSTLHSFLLRSRSPLPISAYIPIIYSVIHYATPPLSFSSKDRRRECSPIFSPHHHSTLTHRLSVAPFRELSIIASTTYFLTSLLYL